MNIEQIIIECLEKHPGASAIRVLKFCKATNRHPINTDFDRFKSTVYKKLRTLKKQRKVLNKGDSWYLMK